MFNLINNGTQDFKGKVIYADRGIYRHYGIGSDYGRAIHFSGNDSASARVIETSLGEFAGISPINVCMRSDAVYSPDEIVSRARSKLYTDFGGYDVINNNCEHFAIWCATGKNSSNQVIFRNDDKDIVEKAIDIVFEPGAKVCQAIDDAIEGTLDFFSKIFKEPQANYYVTEGNKM